MKTAHKVQYLGPSQYLSWRGGGGGWGGGGGGVERKFLEQKFGTPLRVKQTLKGVG